MVAKKVKTRTQKAKLNMAFSLLQQAVAFVCGMIVPKLMINSFGSEAYGATSSIATFLSYITLLEGGIGAVTRSALYKAFASGSNDYISAVVLESKRFYRKIAFAFLGYVLFIAFSYKAISHNNAFSYWYSVGLVFVIAISTYADYFIGITYSMLLQADQSNYVIAYFRIVTTLLNTICIVVLISLKWDILTVKLVSSFVFALRPVCIAYYVQKHYHLSSVNNANSEESFLKNKRSAIGQHIAWALHNNTDITVLTIFKDLTYVSVYSVYNMVISQMQSLLNSFTSGMEAVFGSMYTNNEIDNLQKTFGYYETLISLISVTLFSTTAVLIVPFVKLYTSGVTDAQYINPVFAIMLIIAALLYCFRTPYGHMIIASGRFKETQIAAYGEAIINIIVSIVLVIYYGLVGVAIGTVMATLFRFVYYALYLSKHVLHRSALLCAKRIITSIFAFASTLLLGECILLKLSTNSYKSWAIAGVVVTFEAGLVSFLFNWIVYKNDVIAIINRGFGRINKRKE